MYKKLFSAIIFFIFAVFAFAEVPEDWYQGKPIVGISYEGLTTIQPSELAGISAQYKGKPFSDAVYWEILQKLYSLDYFTEINPKALTADPDYQTVLLQFSCKEKPYIKEIKFVGNTNIRKGTILEKCLLKKGAIYHEVKRRSDEQAVKALYLEKGYDAVEVSCNVTEDKASNSITLEYIVKEGKQTIVSAIFFEGNKKFSEKALKKVLISKEAKGFRKGIYQDAFLEEDKLAIELFYGEKGYIDGHIENIKKEIDSASDPARNLITLTYIIMEGEEFTYNGVKFTGNRIFPSEILAEKIKIKEGASFNLKRFKIGYNAIADMYFENGYTSTFIDKKEIRDNALKKIGYEIIINESSRSHIESITIKGNKKTKENVILRELLFTSGDVFSKKKFLNSLRNLYNLRYFSSIVPDVQQGSETDLLDITLNVEESSTANIQFGVTFSGVSDPDGFPISLFAEWEERNLMGKGSELSAKLNAGKETQSLVLGYTENWFLGTPLSMGFDFSVTHKKNYAYNDVLFPFDVPDPFMSMDEYRSNPLLAEAYKMHYDRMEFGFGINSSYRWFPIFAMITLRNGINFNLVKNFYDAKLYRPSDFVVREQQKRWGLSNSFWTRLSIDDRDFAHDPSKGWFLSEQITFFGLIPKVESEYFFKSETKGECYFTLLDYPVSEAWHLKFVLGFYSGFTFQLPMPNSKITEINKLFIDGMFNGRGWYSLGIRGRGDVMQNNWIEFRWPLAHGILSFDFFFDAIAVKDDLTDLRTLSINDYYFSFGPGLRLTLPQFPLRLMFANTFKSDNGKPRWGNGKRADWNFVLSFNIPNL